MFVACCFVLNCKSLQGSLVTLLTFKPNIFTFYVLQQEGKAGNATLNPLPRISFEAQLLHSIRIFGIIV